jgi:Tfp pilus assembly protein PilP
MHIIRLSLLVFLLFLLALAAPAMSQTDADNATAVIVEKNLFHPERKKYVMEIAKDKKEEKKQTQEKKELATIELYGTVIAGGQRYAVLRTKKEAKPTAKTIFSVGDYVGGYLITAIEDKKVSMRDDAQNEEYVIFINQGTKERTASAAAAKTEIKEEPPAVTTPVASVPKEGASGAKPDEKAKEKTPPKPKDAQTTEVLKKRLERDMKVLQGRKSNLVKKQAQKDYSKLEEMLPSMSDQERQEVLEMKKELDRLSKD